MDCRVKPGNDEGFACLMACKKYGCRLLTGLPNPAVIIVTNDGTTTRERDRAELVLDYTLGSGLRSPEVSALGRPQAGAGMIFSENRYALFGIMPLALRAPGALRDADLMGLGRLGMTG